MNKRTKILSVIFLIVLVGSIFMLGSCTSQKKKVTTTSDSLINRVSTLEGLVATLNNSVTTLQSQNGVSNYSFTLKDNIIHVTLPPGTDIVSFIIHIIPSTPIQLKSTDYDSAFNEACNGKFVNISYIPQITYDGTNYYISEMLCHSTKYTLNSSEQNVQIPCNITVPCSIYIGILEAVQ